VVAFAHGGRDPAQELVEGDGAEGFTPGVVGAGHDGRDRAGPGAFFGCHGARAALADLLAHERARRAFNRVEDLQHGDVAHGAGQQEPAVGAWRGVQQPGAGQRLQAGLVFAPAGIAFSAAAIGGPRLIARYGQRTVPAGALLTAACLALLALSLHAWGSHASPAPIAALTAIASLGNGMVLPSLISAALTDVAPRRAGLAAGALSTTQQFASAAGVAAIGALFFTAVHGPHDPRGYAAGMTRSAITCCALSLLVAALTWLSARAAA
jgi:MFS family permease